MDIKPAYKGDPGIRRVSRGSVSKPSDPSGTAYKITAANQAPRIVKRGSVSHPRG